MFLENALFEGRAFFANDAATLAGGASRQIMLITPVHNSVQHLCINVFATADVTITLSEAGDRTAGTAITARNRDRNSKKAAQMTLSHTPTGGSTDGTTILTQYTPSTGNVYQIVGGGWHSGNSITLKSGMKYIVTITDVAGGCNAATNLYWIEELRSPVTTTTTTSTTSSTSTTTSSSSSTASTSSTYSTTTTSSSTTSSSTTTTSSSSSTSTTTSSTTTVTAV